MTLRALAALALAAALGLAAASLPARTPSRPFQKGMALADHVGRHDHAEGVESARRLRATGCDWIQISPFAFQRDVAKPEIRFRDDTITQTAYFDSLRALGFHILLKPDIWSQQFWSGTVWRGDIAMTSEDDWRAWFSGYRDFMIHYAELAERERVEMLCIGLEYVAATRIRPDDWRALIRDLRAAYSGPLTYASHWPGEADQISFWQELDAIGVNLYPDLCETPVASAEDLSSSWSDTLARLEALSTKWKRPIIVTEIGFSSTLAAANDPWRWVDDDEPVSEREQALCYEAAFRALWGKPWLEGVYWWKWFIEPEAGGPNDSGFTPQGKEAELVLTRWYRGERIGGEPGAYEVRGSD
jgi:hypothetical protein